MSTPTLLPLLDYLKHTLLLGEKPVHTVEGGDGLVEHQAQLESLPGVTVAKDPEEGEPWLEVERLVKSLPPDPAPEFAAWFDVPAGPYDAPTLRDRPREAPEPTVLADGTVDDPIALVDRAPIEAALSDYAKGPHAAWAQKERQRLRTIKFYRQLFTLAETLAQNPDRELVWGWGMALWKQPAFPTAMNYPLLTQAVDLTIDPKTQKIAVVPTAAPVHAELLSFLAAKIPGAVRVKGIWEEELDLAQSVTPFQTETSREFFQQAVSLLDADGQLLPSAAIKGPTLPAPGRFLQVAERWVLFDRKRSSAALIQDMAQLAAHSQTLPELPLPALSLLTAPEDQELNHTRVDFKGVYDGNQTPGTALPQSELRELYFPLPSNDDQIQLAANLEAGRSQVTQGPPGTGKSHTIVNIMAHAMAKGMSVLVTSKGTPALRVLQEKLPAELRALCVFMLQGEKDGMREFEASIDHLAQQISRLDEAKLAADIAQSETQLDALHSQMAAVDRQTLDVARQHLAPLTVSGEAISALDLVQRQQAGEARHRWFTDAVPMTPAVPTLNLDRIRDLRAQLGAQIALAAEPAPSVLWSAEEAAWRHQALLDRDQARDRLQALPWKWTGPLAARDKLVTEWATWLKDADALLAADPAWLPAFEMAYLKSDAAVRQAHEKIVPHIEQHAAQNTAFVLRPVDVPAGVNVAELQTALAARQQGQSKLGRWMQESKAVRQALAATRVDGEPMQDADLDHVSKYLTHAQTQHRLKRKWQALAQALELPTKLDADLAQRTRTAAHLLVLVPQTLAQLPTAGLKINPTVRDLAETLRALLEWDRMERLQAAGQQVDDELTDLRQAARRLGEGELISAWRHQLEALAHGRWEAADWAQVSVLAHAQTRLKPAHAQLMDALESVTAHGASQWAHRLATEAPSEPDALCPTDWAEAWAWRQADQAVAQLPGLRALADLQAQRHALEEQLNATRQRVIVQRTWLRVLERATPKVRAGLEAYLKAVKKIGKGTGKAAGRHRQDARVAMAAIYQAIPCWVMPHDRAVEFLPSRVGDFDLVVLDEASQSDLRALPALLRGRQWLVVGDEKQVSPSNVGKIDEEEMLRLRRQYLKDAPFAAQLTPDNSVYDLCKVALAAQGAQVVLVEHFRSHPAIIEFSNREYYNHSLRALRIQKPSEKFDPPLVDVLIQGGTRKGKLNLPEARFIVDEIKALVEDPAHAHRTIGVVSLLGTEQVSKIQDMILAEIGEEAVTRHQIECGDAARFQGKERSVMFMSMVATPEDVHPATRLDDRQRFNVAASRARDRLYLVRSVGLDDLTSPDDQKRKLVAHFQAPFVVTEEQRQKAEKLFDSPFEKAVYERLVQAGYRVRPQMPAGGFRIDLVVLGGQGRKLAVECDGDRFHGLDQWPADMARQRTLERVGWTFWRCFASSWHRDPEGSFADLVETLSGLGIEPGAVADEQDDFWVERRVIAPRVIVDTTKPSKRGRKALTTEDDADDASDSDEEQAEESTKPVAAKAAAKRKPRKSAPVTVTEPQASE